MFILLIASSESPTTLETIQGLATAAHTREHRIEIFFDAESVQLLNVKGGARNVANLVSQDIRLLACRTSAKELGMASPDDLADKPFRVPWRRIRWSPWRVEWAGWTRPSWSDLSCPLNS